MKQCLDFLLVADTVTLSDSLAITGQQLGVAIETEGFQGVDGILGIGELYALFYTTDTHVLL